jgi:urea transporter
MPGSVSPWMHFSWKDRMTSLFNNNGVSIENGSSHFFVSLGLPSFTLPKKRANLICLLAKNEIWVHGKNVTETK